ncbi:hypothetical protein BGZ73_003842 [Actinomortierella ambigua]|nr:hypothetical protein BGZ73_003842 [Actinomortierella ambigua]
MNIIRRCGIRSPTVILFLSYLFDWVLCIVLLGLFFLLDTVTPFKREFSVQDKSIMYPLKSDTIPNWLLGVIAAALPAVVIVIVAIGVRRSPYDLHNGILGLLLAVLLTTMLTQVVKLEPFARIFYHDANHASTGPSRQPTPPWGYGQWTSVQTPTKKSWMRAVELFLLGMHPVRRNEREGCRLGYNKPSFAGLTYLSLWMAGKMHIFDRRGYSLKPILVALPLLGAALVAISRIQDYRHTAIQVTWGSIIGIVCALFSYHQYYPSLASRNSHIPFPPRDFSHWFSDRSQAPSEYEEQAREELGLSPRSSTSSRRQQQTSHPLSPLAGPTGVRSYSLSPSTMRKASDGVGGGGGLLTEDTALDTRPTHQPADESWRPSSAHVNYGSTRRNDSNSGPSIDAPTSVTVIGSHRSSPQ